MVAGTWTGTMNLTEPQAGSDLAAVRTRAVPQGDGTLQALRPEDLHHLRRARLHREHHPPGARAHAGRAAKASRASRCSSCRSSWSTPTAALGARNDVHCVSLEHKLGIHASPTAVLAYGDKGGAIGYLVGEENRGLEYMFIMMNLARFSVGMEGVGIAERAYQRAVALRARSRAGQGGRTGRRRAKADADHRASGHPPHADDDARATPRRRARVAYVTAAALDNARRNPDADARASAPGVRRSHDPDRQGLVAPRSAQEVASLGVQVHGGMGFIEETGAAQHLRDARITTIYEGTTGIQANDLIGRKTARDGGRRAPGDRCRDATRSPPSSRAHREPALQADRRGSSRTARPRSCKPIDWMVAASRQQPRAAHAGAVAYLQLWGLAAGGWQMGRAALIAADKLAAGEGDAHFLHNKIATARFYATALLPQASGYARTVIQGGETALALAAEQF